MALTIQTSPLATNARGDVLFHVDVKIFAVKETRSLHLPLCNTAVRFL